MTINRWSFLYPGVKADMDTIEFVNSRLKINYQIINGDQFVIAQMILLWRSPSWQPVILERRSSV